MDSSSSYSCSCKNKSPYYATSYNSESDTYRHHQPFPTSQARKFQAKNHSSSYQYRNKRQPIAPSPPNPPRIYQVEPRNFKEVVQMLTCAPEFQPSLRLQEVAPPPLSLSPPQQRFGSGALSPTTMGFNLSPSSLAWCSSYLMSPGTTGPSPAII